jgi:ABC-type sugar transport system permease subunit
LILILLFTYYPFVELFRISFTNWNLLSKEYQFVGLKNYNWLIYGSGFTYLLESLRITGVYIFWDTAITVLGGLLVALLFSKATRPHRIMRALIAVPRFFMITSGAVVFTWILSSPYGILNYWLSLFRIQGPNWLHQASTAMTSILFLSAWRSLGYGMIIYFAAMRSIPADYYEAAILEGADPMRRFRMITLPSVKPYIVYLLIVSLTSGMEVFQSVDVMTGGGPYDATKVVSLWIYSLAFEDHQIDRASAVSVLYFLMLMILTLSTMHFVYKTAEDR